MDTPQPKPVSRQKRPATPTRRWSALRLLVYGYSAAIVLGTLLLWLPWAQAAPVSVLDCLFTATSAVTLTGLVTVPTAGAWTPLGQVILLLLIQGGGLAIMIAGALIALALGRRLGLNTGGPMRGGSGQTPAGPRVVRFVLVGTLIAEAVGALILTLLLRFAHGHTWGAALAEGVFTSISAFCNAGFVLTPGQASLLPYAGNPWLLLTISALVVLGGLGAITVAEIARRRRERRLSLQTKLVLLTTAALLLAGMLGFLFFEGWVMDPARPGQSLTTAWFMSVTSRTAGFMPVPLGDFTPPTLLVFGLLMLVGGSPTGAAGGVKTTTLAVILATILTLLRRREDVEGFGRRLGRETIRLALSLMGIYIFGLLAAMLAISLVEVTLRPEAPLGLGPDAYFPQVLFETLSAYTNTGLTHGITPYLSPVSRAILIIAMLAGRLGPLAFVHVFARGRKPQLRQLPDEPVMVG